MEGKELEVIEKCGHVRGRCGQRFANWLGRWVWVWVRLKISAGGAHVSRNAGEGGVWTRERCG